MTIDQVPNVLACDVGNTAIHIASLCGEEVSEMRHFRLGDLARLGEALQQLWNDVPTPKKLVRLQRESRGPEGLEAAASEAIQQDTLVVGRDLPLPLDTKLEHPESVGVDRLCAAVAAFDRLGVACVVADFGTAITIDCIDDEGVFLGGAILPGLGMSADRPPPAHRQLPRVELSAPRLGLRAPNEPSIVGGLVYGARGALRELVESLTPPPWATGRWSCSPAATPRSSARHRRVRLGAGHRGGSGPPWSGHGVLQVFAEITQAVRQKAVGNRNGNNRHGHLAPDTRNDTEDRIPDTGRPSTATADQALGASHLLRGGAPVPPRQVTGNR